MYTETRTITIDDNGLESWLARLVRNQALLFPEIKQITLYGSQATGEADRYSDYDLAIDTDEISREKWHLITDQVNIARNLRRVDCVQFSRVPPALQQEILHDGKVLYVRH